MPRLLVILAAAGALAAPASAQFIITEVFTGTPDYVEICNVSAVPQPVFGLGIMTANSTVCPAWSAADPLLGTAQMNGPYVSASGAVVPPGGHYVFAELGAAGAPTAGYPGETTGFAITWAGGSAVEVALYASATILAGVIDGVPLDYICFQTVSSASYVTGYGPNAITVPLAFPVLDGWRYNPPFVPGLWKSLPFRRLSAADDVYRKAPYADTQADADWSAAAAGTPGLANAAGPAVMPTPGIDLEITIPAPGAFSLRVVTGNPPLPGQQLYNLISLTPTFCAGSGPIFGLAIDVLPELTLPVGMAPFHVLLDAAGIYTFVLPAGTVPPGIAFEAVSVAMDPLPGGIIEGYRLSNYVYLTT